MARFLLTVIFIAAAAFAPTTWMLDRGTAPETQGSLVEAPAATPDILIADVRPERAVAPTVAR